MGLKQVREELRAVADPERAVAGQRFFKTGKGEYGEGDKFLGCTVPDARRVVRRHRELSYEDIGKLLDSQWHEERHVGLLMLVDRFARADEKERGKIYRFYIKNRKAVNNWDLVDTTTPNIVGEYLVGHPRDVLYRFAKSKDLWERRIAILATAAFIRRNDFADTLAISDILLEDKHDLIHKAVGWMVREVGKRDQEVMEKFLKPRYKKMPRTMLRYAIEKLPEERRKKYLRGEI
jgi:3-methyladenine DNA glycosylase AlkD